MKIIKSDWLDIQIAVFRSYEKYQKVAKKNKIQNYDMPVGTNAFYQYCVNSDGETFFLVCFPQEETSYKTIVHESSHITDAIFSHMGFDECTETRAYFTAWLFGEILDIIING